MKQQKFSFLSIPSLALPPAAMSTILIFYLILNIGLAFLMPIFPLVGVLGALVINLIVVFFVQSQLALPFYILVAGPSVALSLSTTGILSRFYIGNLLFALIMSIWILKTVLSERKSRQVQLELSLMVPLVALIAVGLISIIYSRLFPDPTVSYSFTHSNVSITLVNLSEMALLIGLPMFLLIVPGMVRRIRDVKLVLGAYIVIGLIYATGTIFAAPLGLYSKEIILGVRRPEVFGSVSSGLGSLILLFTCLALGQALYARRDASRLGWGLLTTVFSIAVIMTFGRESWIALFLSVLLMVGLRIKKWSVLLLLLVPLLLLLIPGVSDFFDPSKVYGADRFKIWLDAIAIWQRSPYFGVGAGNYQFFDLTYGKNVIGIAHNQYLQVLAEMGVQGLLCLLWLIVAIGRIAFKRFSAATTDMSKALSLAYLGFFVSLIFGGFFTSTFIPSAASGGGTGPFVEASYRWLFLGLILSTYYYKPFLRLTGSTREDSGVTKQVPKPDKTRQQEDVLIPPLSKQKQWEEKSTNRSLAFQQYDDVTSPTSGPQLEELDTNPHPRDSLLKTSGSDDNRPGFENHGTIPLVVFKGMISHPEMFLLGLALLLVSFLSLFLIGSKSLWFDESYSVQLVHSWGSMWLELFRYDRNAWLYYTLLYGWTRLGDGEAYIRVLSALFAIVSLPVYYLLSKRLFGKKVALIAAFLLAVNGFYIRYAQEARAYSLYFLLSLLSTLIFLHLRNKKSKLPYFLYILCVILSIYAHALAIFLLAIHALIVLFTSRSFWKQYAICAIIIIACAFPVLSHQGNVKDALGWLSPVDVLTLPRYFLSLSVGQPVLCLLYAIPCGIATVWIMRRMRKARKHTSLWKYAFVYIWLFLPLLLTFFYSLLIHPLFAPRYLIIGLAPFLLLVSIGLTKIPNRLVLYLCLISIGALSLLSLIGWYNGDQRIALVLGNKNEDWRTAVAYVCTHATVNDSVTFYAYFVHIPYDYYAQKSTMCLHQHLHEIELASAAYGSGGGGSLPAPNMLLLKNLPTSTNRIWLVISHDNIPAPRVAQRNMIQQMLATNYSLVSMKKFQEIEVQLYTRSRSQVKVAATSYTVYPAPRLFEMSPWRSGEPQDISGSLLF